MELGADIITARDDRMFERFHARFPAKIKDSREDFGQSIYLRDASADGFRISTRTQLYVNDTITIEVKLPDGLEPMKLRGQVIWTSAQEEENFWHAGVKFHKIDFFSMSRLYKFIDEATLNNL